VGRKRKPVAKYVEHKQSGRARVIYYDSTGKRREQLLPGLFNSIESTQAYGKFLLEQQVAPKGSAIPESDRDWLSLVEVLESYNTHAESHYRGPDGKVTSELREHKLVIRALREMYGETPAKDFGPLNLKAVRQGWVAAGLSRGEVNRRLGIAKRIFRWVVSEELVKGFDLSALDAVEGLQKGRTIARETEPVEPVGDARVDAVLPFLNRFLVGLIELQRLTGMRPGEACIIRRCDIDVGGKVWVYKPEKHKTAHRGKTRIIAIGPRAQEILKPFFTTDINDYLFPPRLAVEELHASRTKQRQTPRYKSHMERNDKKRTKRPKRAPGEYFLPGSYVHAIGRACDRAFPAPAPLCQREDETHAEWQDRLTEGQKEKLKEWQKANRWHPNQLRHTFATRVRKEHGLEAAQVLLGHSRADVTQIYADRNQALATEIAAKLG